VTTLGHAGYCQLLLTFGNYLVDSTRLINNSIVIRLSTVLSSCIRASLVGILKLQCINGLFVIERRFDVEKQLL
jgi:hypothetical protein